MSHPYALAFITCLSFLSACQKKPPVEFHYPSKVVQLHLHRSYRTALWVAYVWPLQCHLFPQRQQKASADSVLNTFRQFLGTKSTLRDVTAYPHGVCFRFQHESKSIDQANAYDIVPVSAVYINTQDGGVDSLLDYRNRMFYPRRSMERPAGKGHFPEPMNRRPLLTEEPCRDAFLTQNRKWLHPELRTLCQEKTFVPQQQSL